jgi:ribosomal-protein-alanine N-acetyltransferase
MTHVSRAFPGHAASLAAIHAAALQDKGDTPWEAQFLADVLGKPQILGWLGAKDGETAGRLAGFLMVQRAVDEAEILMVATAPEARRQGVARALIEAAILELRGVGVSVLHLEVAEDNAPARALYEGLGFDQIGRRAEYYARNGARVDALLLRRNLVESPPNSR